MEYRFPLRRELKGLSLVALGRKQAHVGHGHGHDADGNCVDEDDYSAPFNWWRAQITDNFPPFEMDCCGPGKPSLPPSAARAQQFL